MDRSEFPLSHESLAQDYELLMLALQASRSGIILTDNRQPDNPIIYSNEAFTRISGYTYNEIIGRNCRFLQGEDRGQAARSVLAEAVKKGEECVVELRNYRKNGSLFWNELYMSPVKNKEGEVTHFIGVQNDITARKNAEAELHTEKELLERRVEDRTAYLKESEDYLKSIIETVRESLLVLDKDFTVVSANQFFFKTYRLAPQQVLNKSLFDLDGGKWNIPDLKSLLEIVLPKNNPFEGFEMAHDLESTGKKFMVLNARRIETEGRFKDRILLAMEDITQFKENEKRKDDFLSIASHELRTPLTTVKGYNQLIEMLLKTGNNEKLLETLQKSNLYVEKLNSLITDLLDVSRIQAGHIQLHKTLFDFDEMVRGCVESMQTGTETHTIHILRAVDLSYYGDKERIEQVFVNLLQNAAKYSPQSKDINVYVSRVNNFIKVSVTDFGVGIKPTDQKRIFERFYRAQETQKDYAGIGIGLYVCEQIIKQHEGYLWVESEYGKGSTFSFTLPIKQNGENE